MSVDSYSVGIMVFCMLVNVPYIAISVHLYCTSFYRLAFSLPYEDDPKLTREERIKARVFNWDMLEHKLDQNVANGTCSLHLGILIAI